MPDTVMVVPAVTQPPSSIVLIFDTSASMSGSTEDLQAAVGAFVRQMGAGERMNLVRFLDGEPEVLLPDFSGDPDELLSAADGKFIAEDETPLFDAIAKGVRSVGLDTRRRGAGAARGDLVVAAVPARFPCSSDGSRLLITTPRLA